MLIFFLIVFVVSRKFEKEIIDIDQSDIEVKISHQNCKVLQFNSPNNILNLQFTDVKNFQNILITNEELGDIECNYGGIKEKCLKISNLCYFENLKYEQDSVEIYKKNCSEKTFVYIQTNIGDAKGKFNVVKSSKQCSLIDPCDNSLACLETCDDKCIQVDCDGKKICASKEIKSYRSKCEDITQKEFPGAVQTRDLCEQTKERIYSQIKKSDPWMDLFVLIILVFLFSFCYYRIVFAIKGEPPFDASCCPEILFPKKKEFKQRVELNEEFPDNYQMQIK